MSNELLCWIVGMSCTAFSIGYQYGFARGLLFFGIGMMVTCVAIGIGNADFSE